MRRYLLICWVCFCWYLFQSCTNIVLPSDAIILENEKCIQFENTFRLSRKTPGANSNISEWKPFNLLELSEEKKRKGGEATRESGSKLNYWSTDAGHDNKLTAISKRNKSFDLSCSTGGDLVHIQFAFYLGCRMQNGSFEMVQISHFKIWSLANFDNLKSYHFLHQLLKVNDVLKFILTLQRHLLMKFHVHLHLTDKKRNS